MARLFRILWSMTLFTVMAHGGSASARVQLPPWQDPAYIERIFYDIALHGEHEQLRPVVRKWNQPLKVWIASSAGDAAQQRWMLAMHFLHLGSITGLPVEFVPSSRLANIRIFFTGKDTDQVVAKQMSHTAQSVMPHSYCLGQVHFNRRGEITRGTVVVPVERAQAAGRLVPCVVEEITQMLGLFNDSREARHSVFNDYSDAELLTGLDYVLLKLLYSPHLRSGMTQQQISPVVRQHLQAWSRNGLLRAADATIAQGALYSLR